MLEKWRVVASRVSFEDRWLKVRTDRCVDRAGRPIEAYHVLEFPTWVNVVAITRDRQIVLAREYRHGVGAVLTGLPCGAMERGDADAEGAARRELEEETGYGGGEFVGLASNHANPANQDNTARAVLLLGVGPVGPQRLDPTEEIEVVREDFVDFMARYWRDGVAIQVSHAHALDRAAMTLMTPGRPDWADLRAALQAEFLRVIRPTI